MTQPTPVGSDKRASVESTLLTLAVLGAVVLLLSITTFVPSGSSTVAASNGPGGSTSNGDSVAYVDETGAPVATGDTPADAVQTSASGSGSAQSQAVPGVQTPAAKKDPGVDCKSGKNLGATDPGVTANSIKLGASIVSSGAGASFLHPVVTAMNAMVAKTNSSGGVCGRALKLVVHDSGWRAEAGFEIIRNMVQGEKVFALAVNPDSEGLDFASTQQYLSKHQVPVVGTDGLLISQYQDPYIWPVATPTVSAMYAIAKSQCDSGLKKFSIVFETTYRFGREGAKAYNLAAKACTGQNIDGYYDPNEGQSRCADSSGSTNFCGILSGATSYNGEVANYCKPTQGECDAGAILLEPASAQVWLANGGPGPGSYRAADKPGALGTPQPLFSGSFAKQCDKVCDKLRVWTGFLPPIEQFASRPAVQQYVNDVKAFDPSIDVENQFVEGGYLGMLLLVKAMTTASEMPSGLTRKNLVTVLDSLSNFDTGLTVKPLSWSPGNHFAQTTVHAFDEQYGDTGFGGWRYTGIQVTDPDPFAATK